MLTFCHIAIQTFRPCKVLTRRDQLKLKESKIAEKEEAKKAKAATSKPAAKRKAKAKAQALAKAEEDEASEEGVNEDKDVEPMAKPKARGRKRKGNQDNDENAVEEEPEPKKPKKKAQPKAKSEQPKSRGRPKAKPLPKDPEEEDDDVVPSQPELDSDMKVDEVKHEAAPKKAPKRKAKAPKTEKLENTDAMKDEPVTPKKELFQSGGEEEESEHERIVDPKTGKTMPLAMIFEEDKVAGWKKSRAKPAKAKTSEPSAASTADGKKKGQKKQQLSPFAKKEVRRRKKVEDESMREVPQEDLKLQGIFLQHLKASQDLGYEGEELLDRYSPQGHEGVSPQPVLGKAGLWCKVESIGFRQENARGHLHWQVWHCFLLERQRRSVLHQCFAHGFLAEIIFCSVHLMGNWSHVWPFDFLQYTKIQTSPDYFDQFPAPCWHFNYLGQCSM